MAHANLITPAGLLLVGGIPDGSTARKDLLGLVGLVLLRVSAFRRLINGFSGGIARGRLPQLADRDDLFKLLVVITTPEAVAQAQRAGRKTRGDGRIVDDMVLYVTSAGDDGSIAGLERIADDAPSHEFAAMMTKRCERLLGTLDDDPRRRVAPSRMEGYANDEIADQLGSARRTIVRRLDLVRKSWVSLVEEI
jgi:DNA-directed RNA polymerase specialized sigma24 family protein